MNPLALLSGLSPKVWEIVGVVVAIGAFGGYCYYKGGVGPREERDTLQAQFKAFREQIKQLGKEAKNKAKETEAANKAAKEKADAQISKAEDDLAAIYAKYRRLRNGTNSGAGSGAMPPAPAVTSSTNRTCFDTTKLAGAMGVLEAGVPNITEQGDVARTRLQGAMKWAQSLAKP